MPKCREKAKAGSEPASQLWYGNDVVGGVRVKAVNTGTTIFTLSLVCRVNRLNYEFLIAN